MLSYAEFKTKKKKVNKNLSYASFLERQVEKQRVSNVPAEKAQRIEQGLPVSLSKNRAEPGIFQSIVGAVVKPAYDVLFNVNNALEIALGKPETKSAYTKITGEIKGLGKVDVTKSPFDKDNLKVILNSAATGAEIASYLTGAGVAKSTVVGLTQRGILASKATFAEWVVQNFPKLAKEGFLQGVAYTAGSQGREYVASGTKPSAERAVTDIALSTLGTVAIPGALQKVFGSSSKKILNARETERAIANARILGREIPDAGVPSARYMTESGRTLPAPRKPGEIPIELPGRGILKSAEDLRKLPQKVQEQIQLSPIEKKAELFYSRNDFINYWKQGVAFAKNLNKDVGKFQKGFKAVEVPKEYTDKQLAKIWDDAHSSTLTPKMKPVESYSIPTKTAPTKPFVTAKEFAEQKTGTTSTPPTPTQTLPTLPKAQNQLLKDVERMADELEGFEPSTFVEFSREIRKLDPDEVMNVAMGGEKTIPNTIPANAYLSIAKNIAEETGNVKMIKELASSDVASKAGQELVSSRMTTAGNIVDDLREVRLQKIRNKKIDEKKIIQEQGTLIEKIQTKMKEVAKVSKQEVDNIINSLICK